MKRTAPTDARAYIHTSVVLQQLRDEAPKDYVTLGWLIPSRVALYLYALLLPLIVMQQQRIQGVTVGSVEDLQAMVDAIALNRMHPVVDRVFPFAEAKAAFAHMASGKHFGKVAIAIG